MKREGRVKCCNSRGYGFIETDQKIDFYFHSTQFKGDWKDLLKRFVCNEIIIVEFDNDKNAPEGPRALNVSIKDAINA